MRYSITQQTKSIARVRILFMAALVFACAFGTVSNAAAQNLTSPPTPTNITPEEGNVAFLVGHAKGTQGYTCLPTSTGGTAWTVTPPAPKLPFLQVSSGMTSRSSPTSSAPMQIPTTSPQSRYLPGATLPGKALSIAAGCGRCRRWEHRSSPAPTRVARMLARFPASCCNQSATKRGRRAVASWPTSASSNA
jgi:hypothetical protein